MSVPSEGNTPYGPGWSHLGTLLTIPEVAAILNVSVPRVYELIRLRLLPAVHLGRQVRVKPDVLAEWLAQGGQQRPTGRD
jgi:excisionase family DNA binding protein